MPNDTSTETETTTEATTDKKRSPAFTQLGSFPVGDATAIVRIKGDREPTSDDLRHAATACEELTVTIRKKLAALE